MNSPKRHAKIFTASYLLPDRPNYWHPNIGTSTNTYLKLNMEKQETLALTQHYFR